MDCKLVRATSRKRYSPLLKTAKLPGLRLNKKKKEVKGVDKARYDDTISNSNKSSEYPNVKSRPLTSSELQNRVFLENMKQEVHGVKNQEQISHDVLSSCNDLLLRHLRLQRLLDEDIKTKIPGKNLYASKIPLIIVNQLCDDSQEPQANLSTPRDHLHDIALSYGVQNKGIPNLLTSIMNVPKPLNRDLDIRSNTSSVIQNPTDKVNQSCQLEVPKLPVNPNHLEVLPIQTTPRQSSEVESPIPKSSYCRKMKIASYSSVINSNAAEHQDSIIEKMAVDKLSETSCIEPKGFSERKAESESFINPNSLKNVNHSGQSAESTVEEESPVVDKVTSSDVSSMQDVDNDEQINSSEMNSEEMFNSCSESNEDVNQSVDSILNTENQLLNFLQKIEVDFIKYCQMARYLHKSLVQSHEVIKCIANASKNFQESKEGKVTTGTSKGITVKGQQMSEENQAKEKEEEIPDDNVEQERKEIDDVDSKRDDNDDDDDDDVNNDEDFKEVKNRVRNNKIRKRIGRHIRTFVFPPEYDPDDTRWTLKYRENDPELNLVELIPGSNVFINSTKLAHCKKAAKDGNSLARMLLVEVFSQSALSVCSWTGNRPTAYDVSGTNVRPGLDENARMAILSFVEEYAFTHMSGAFDTYAVVNSLRNKIQEIRAICKNESKAVFQESLVEVID